MQYALFYIDFFVNSIQKNHHLTALNGDFIIVCVTFLIMCFNWLLPFLHIETDKSLLYSERCQCPLSGFLHFYTHSNRCRTHSRMAVSMPFIGLSPFLPGHLLLHSTNLICVNALYRAFSISTRSKYDKARCVARVNALYRAFSISTTNY